MANFEEEEEELERRASWSPLRLQMFINSS
jgi:hypothetical protein